jgi:chemotaxis protein methyltransferase CheR
VAAEVTGAATPLDPEDIERDLLLEAVYRRYHYDFRRYAPASLRRRLRQAMIATGATSLSALQASVLRDPSEFARLLQYLTVQVSELFRDPPYWRALRHHVVPFLRTFPYARLWVAGCSEGEEVYSLAILLHEADLLDRTLIYATDVNPEALRRAEAGIYPIERMSTFSEAYLSAAGAGTLSDYYVAGHGHAVFDKSLRRNVVFSDHSLATDGVFAEVQMVLCRNVLIYFDRDLQDRTLRLFRDSLCHRGFLGLGARETTRYGAMASAYAEVDADARLYRRA